MKIVRIQMTLCLNARWNSWSGSGSYLTLDLGEVLLYTEQQKGRKALAKPPWDESEATTTEFRGQVK